MRCPAVLIASVLFSLSLSSTTSADDSIAGRWRIDATRFGEEKLYFVELKVDGEKVSGTWESPRTGRYPFDGGSFKGGVLKFQVERKREGAETRLYALEVKKAGKRLEGRFLVNGEEAGKAVLSPFVHPALGDWDVVAKSPDGSQEYKATLQVREGEDGLKGTYVSQIGNFDARGIRVEEETLVFELVLPIDGNDVPLRIRAEFEGENRLIGRWAVTTRDDFSGEWTATRGAVAKAESAAPSVKADPALVKAFAGRWYGTAKLPDGEYKEFRLEIRNDGGSLEGKLQHDRGEADVRDVRLAEGKIQFHFEVNTDDGKVDIKIEAKLGDDGVLRGKFTAPDNNTGEISARKPVEI